MRARQRVSCRASVRSRRFAAIALALLTLAAPAAAQQAGPAADPLLEAARTAFEALPEAERKAIQDDLVWTGDYNASTSGAFGRRTYEGIVAFETKAQLKADGIVEAKERAALAAAAAKARQAARFAIVTDARNGLRIGVPARYMDKAAPTRSGTRFRSADDAVVLETIAYGEGEADLAALFEQAKADAPPVRKVTYKVLRPDFFVVTGDDRGRRFYTRIAKPPQGSAPTGAQAAAAAGSPAGSPNPPQKGATSGLRGFTLSYPAALAPQLDRVTIAIANSFDPFPGAAAVAAANPAAADARPPQAVDKPPQAVAKPPQADIRSPGGAIASGLIVGPGRVLTAASIGSCSEPLVGKRKSRIARLDQAVGLALLETAPDGQAAPFLGGLRAAALSRGDAIVVLGFAGLPGAPALAIAPGEVGAVEGPVRVLAAPQGNPAGGAVVDRSGALVGLVAGGGAQPRLIAGIVPQASYALVGTAEIERFLKAGGTELKASPAGPARSAGDLVAAYGPSVVPVECGR